MIKLLIRMRSSRRPLLNRRMMKIVKRKQRTTFNKPRWSKILTKIIKSRPVLCKEVDHLRNNSIIIQHFLQWPWIHIIQDTSLLNSPITRDHLKGRPQILLLKWCFKCNNNRWIGCNNKTNKWLWILEWHLNGLILRVTLFILELTLICKDHQGLTGFNLKWVILKCLQWTCLQGHRKPSQILRFLPRFSPPILLSNL